MKNDMAENCQFLFVFKTKLQLTFVLNLISSWPKTTAGVCNTCDGDTDVCGDREVQKLRIFEKLHKNVTYSLFA